MIVTCDKCHKEFESLLKEQTKIIDGNEIIKTYLECPHCGEHFVISLDNQSTLAKKKQIRRHVQMLGTIKDEKKFNAKQSDIEKRSKRLKREERILKAKYLKEFN